MRTFMLTTFILLSLTTVSLAQVRVGPFLAYGNKLGLWGLGAYSEIAINEKMSISLFFTQYFPENLSNIPKRTVWEVNSNLNYYVIRGEVGYLYGLAGLNYTHEKIRTQTASLEIVERDKNIGLNVGIGTMVRINDLLLPFAEGKFTAGGYTQLSLIFGVKFELVPKSSKYDK